MMEKRLEFLIKENPKDFIDQKSFKSFGNFLHGYSYCHYENNIHDSDHWNGFQEYIEDKYNSHTTHGWFDLIDFYSDNDEEAFDNFFKIFEDFLLLPKKNPYMHYVNEEPRPSNYELLKRIYKRPPLYLGEKSFRNLYEFLNGYIYCCKTYNLEETIHLDEFEKYLQQKNKIENRPWNKIIIFWSVGDVNAFENFYKEYSEFLKIKYNIDFSYKE